MLLKSTLSIFTHRELQMEGNGGNQLYPCNSTFTVSYHDEIISEGVIVAALIAIIFMLCVFLIFLVGPLAWKYVRSKIPVSQKRINGRYETIERWMISKRVRCHDDKCCRVSSRTQCRSTAFLAPAVPYCMSSSILPGILEPSLHKDEDTVQLVTTDESTVDEEEKDREQCSVSPLECSICLEPFSCNEIVSWSTNVSCPHTFHHECIKEWLLRRAGCPFCRKPLLAIDCKGTSRFSEVDLEKFVDQWRYRMLSTYFCLQEGLVVLDDSVRENGQLSSIVKDLIVPRVKREDLEMRRGARTVSYPTSPQS